VAESCPPAKVAQFTAVLETQDEAMLDQLTRHPAIILVALSIHVIFHRSSDPLVQTPVTRSKTRNIRSSSKRCTPKKRKTGRNLNGNRKKSTSVSQNKTPMKAEGSRSSSAINNRPNKCSNGILSSSSEYNKDSHRRALLLPSHRRKRNTESISA